MESHSKEGRRKVTYGGRTPMMLEDRAKIFSPFDPLDGFREALRAKEREVEDDIERSGQPSRNSIVQKRPHM